ncbi:hypothetical protein ACIHCQ_05905 [Streptomyces sp. NPDC052236]|uniref:hypothetical protein n=1 Tax=Streptomyces sp. NPDC052236 TaxID=3365686 RepID=UPI0037CDF869
MTLTRRARIAGAVLCAVLALVVGAWIVRDLTTAAAPLDLWRHWTGSRGDASAAPLTTTLEDLALLAVYVTVAVASLRSAVASAALVAAGVITLAVRLPGLWVLSTSWMDLRATEALRTRALYCAFVALALGIGLLITAAAGRRPPEASYAPYDPYAAPRAPYDPTPTRPGQGVSVLAFLLLGAAGGVLAAWEIHTAAEYGGSLYADRITGSESLLLPLLGTPPGWLAAVLVALTLTAAVGALFHAVFSRPLGLAVAVFLVAEGGRGLATAIRYDLLTTVGDLPVREQLLVSTWLFELGAGAVLLLALARRGVSGEPAMGTAGGGAGGGAGGFGAPPPPSSRPPGW